MTLLRNHWALLLALTLAAAILVPYSTVELGRDQANWLTVAMAMEHGSVLYRDVAVVNTPGLGILYLITNAVFKHPFLTPWIVHVFTVLLTIVAGYILLRKLYGPPAAIGGALLAALFWPVSMDWWTIAQKDGVAFAFALSALAALAYGAERRLPDVLAGGLLAMAVMSKTSSVLYAVPVAVQLYRTSDNLRQFLTRSVWLTGGGISVLIFPVLYLSWHDAWPAAWKSLIGRASVYGSNYRRGPLELLLLLLVMISVALRYVLLMPALWLWRRPFRLRPGFPIAALILTTAILVMVQGRGWPDHAVPFIAACTLGFGACLGQILERNIAWQKLAALLLVAGALFQVWGDTDSRWLKYVQRMAGNLPDSEFAALFIAPGMAAHSESRAVGNWIKQNTSPEDKIFVWGMESHVYLYADRMFIGPSFADAPIWHPQLAAERPDYFGRQRERFYRALVDTPPAFFVIARKDANPVEPMPSDKALETLPEVFAFLQANYILTMETEHFLVLQRASVSPVNTGDEAADQPPGAVSRRGS